MSAARSSAPAEGRAEGTGLCNPLRVERTPIVPTGLRAAPWAAAMSRPGVMKTSSAETEAFVFAHRNTQSTMWRFLLQFRLINAFRRSVTPTTTAMAMHAA
jgi:hypothetical protein